MKLIPEYREEHRGLPTWSSIHTLISREKSPGFDFHSGWNFFVRALKVNIG